MWALQAIISALFLGFYDVSKKLSLRDNAVLPVLTISNLCSAVIFLPIIIASVTGAGWFSGTMLDIPHGSMHDHLMVALKAAIVASSWICSYYGLKTTPISIYGPINASRPVLVLLGAFLLFGERLNLLQWAGVSLSFFSLYMLGVSSRKGDGIDFKHNRGIWCVVAGMALGAVSSLYDKHIMRSMDSVFVQSWFSLYEAMLMVVIMLVVWWPRRAKGTPFRWSWAIPLIAIFVSSADFLYFHALSLEGALISVVSMIRRGSVLVSFTCAALIFHEKNLKTKALDLLLILIGMACLVVGSSM